MQVLSSQTTVSHKCFACGTTYSIDRTSGKQRWYVNRDVAGQEIGRFCGKCYDHFVHTPEKVPTDIARGVNKRKIEWFGRPIWLGWNPKKGTCSKCMRTIASGSIRNTNMHHLAYYRIFVWFATIEICPSCHIKITGPRRPKSKV